MSEGFWAAVVQAPVEVITDPSRREEVIRANCTRAIRLMETILAVSPHPPRLFQFPVLLLQGAYNEARSPEARAAIAIELPGPELTPLLEWCAAHQVYLASSCVERHPALPGWTFHSGMLLGPEGVLLRSPKAQARSAAGIHIIKDYYAEYTALFGREAVFPVVATPLGRLALCVEAEVLVPEVARVVAARGAEVLLHPTVERPERRPWAYRAAKVARAVENRLYLLSANVGGSLIRDPQRGVDSYQRAAGGSLVVDYEGMVRCEVEGSGEGWATAYIDLPALRAARALPAPEIEFTPLLYREVYCREA
jgi:predicted amidohydrolase